MLLKNLILTQLKSRFVIKKLDIDNNFYGGHGPGGTDGAGGLVPVVARRGGAEWCLCVCARARVCVDWSAQAVRAGPVQAGPEILGPAEPGLASFFYVLWGGHE